MRIVILGSGNVATFYGHRFLEQQHQIVQVYSPNEEHAKQLALSLQSNYTNQLQQLEADADVYLLACSDNALQGYIESFPYKNKAVLFTAGSISMQEMEGISAHYGCIWCLYSIKKEQLPTSKTIPVFIQGNEASMLDLCNTLAAALSDQVQTIDDEQKLVLHLSAVFCNNFSNHLASIASHLLAEKQLSFAHLRPIIAQTTEKLLSVSPDTAQTGPAIRRDTAVLAKHLHYLQPHPTWQNLYEILSNSIRVMSEEKEDSK